MLTPDYLYHVADAVVDLWEQLNLIAIHDICRRIADAENHMTASAEWQIYKMQQSGMTLTKIQQAAARILKLSEKKVAEIFEEAAVTSHNNDADAFREAGINPSPFGTDQAKKNLQTFYEQTNGELRNFTRTTAAQSQAIYTTACDEAFMVIRNGIKSPSLAIRDAIDKTAAAGLYVLYPSGHRDTVETAVRRAVLTGTNQASLRLCIDECERTGTNFVRVSEHLGARVSDSDPQGNHAGWQGKIYRIWADKPDYWGPSAAMAEITGPLSYPLLSEATGYPDNPLGLGGYNCRHSMTPAMPGITPDRPSKIDLAENREVFEASQQQRAMEREMRKTRRIIEGLKAGIKGANEETRKALEDDLTSKEKVYQKQREAYEAFCKAKGLTPDYERVYVGKRGTSTAHKSIHSNGKPIGRPARSFGLEKEVYYDKNRSYSVDISRYSKEVNRLISEAARDVAEAGSKDRLEYMRMVNLSKNTVTRLYTDSKPSSVGETEIYKCLGDEPGDKFIFIHNHITATMPSIDDIGLMVNNPQIECVITVRVDGTIYVVLSNGKHTDDYLPARYQDEALIMAHEKYGEKVSEDDRIPFSWDVVINTIDLAIKEFSDGGLIIYE